MKQRFPGSQLKFRERKDPGVTGNFEIRVNGALVHSKKTMGHGFFHDSPPQQAAVFQAITAAIA